MVWKAERVEIGREPGAIEIFGDHLAAGGEAGFDPGLGLQAQCARLAGDQAGGDEHVGIGRVGAAGDGRDHHVAVADGEVAAGGGDAVAHIVGRDALVLGEVGEEGGAGVLQRHAVLRALGAGEAGHDGRHVELNGVGEYRIGAGRVAEHALGAQISFHQSDAVFVAAGEVQVGERFRIHREKAAGRTVFRGHVRDGGAVGDREIVERRAEELDELADDALLAEDFGDGEHEVGGGSPFRQLAGEAEADHIGDQHGDRLAQHGGFGLDAAHAPAEHAGAVDHGCVAVGAVQRVRVGEGLAADFGRPDGLADVFEVDLVADAGAGRHHAEVLERFLAPAQEGVAFAVALELDGDVLLQRLRRAGKIDHDGVIDHQVHRHQRVHALRIALQAGDAVAHGGEVDYCGHAGEILHQDAGRLERYFLGAAAGLQPACHLVGVGDRVGLAVLEAQHVFQQNFEADREAADVADGAGGFGDREIRVGFAVHGQGGAGVEAILAGLHGSCVPSLRSCGL